MTQIPIYGTMELFLDNHLIIWDYQIKPRTTWYKIRQSLLGKQPLIIDHFALPRRVVTQDRLYCKRVTFILIVANCM